MTAPGETQLMRAFFGADVALPAPVAATRETTRREAERRVAASADEDGGPVEPWPDSWWDANDPADATACRALWASVVMTCVAGALHDRWGGGITPGVYGRVEASWLGSRDFHACCALAGLDGMAVRDRVAAVWDDEAAARSMMHRLLNRSEKSLRRHQCTE